MLKLRRAQRALGTETLAATLLMILEQYEPPKPVEAADG
jgi:hypothetical protein